MTPDRFHDFFVASAGVAGGLTGLLFVAISVAPERLLSETATQAHRVRAAAALTSFTNALAVSLFALVPGMHLGWPASSVAVIGLLFVGGALVSLLRVRRTQPGELRDAAFLVALVVVFGLQLLYGLRLMRDGEAVGPLRGVSVLVIACFLIGIARAWELIGGPSFAFFGELRGALRQRGGGERRRRAATPTPDPGAAPARSRPVARVRFSFTYRIV